MAFGPDVTDLEFYNNIGDDPNEDLRIFGWHGEEMQFNTTFADGHAGTISHLVRTNATGISDGGDEVFYDGPFVMRGARPEPVLLPFNDPWSGPGAAQIIMRGDGWQLDYFPAPPNIVIASEAEL